MSSPSSVASDARPATGGRGLRHAVVAFRHRPFALFWTGALISNSGTWMQNATVPYVLYEETGSAAWVGVSAFSALFPVMLMGPIGGSLADRFTRKSILLVSQVVQLLIAFGLWMLYAAGLAPPLVIVGVVAVQGLVAGLSIPAWQAFVTELVPRSALLNAVMLNSTQFNAARAVGPAAAGAMLAAFGPSWAFLANALSYVAVVGALLLIHVTPPPRTRSEAGGVHRQFVEALRYVRGSRGIVTALFLVAAVAFLGNPVAQLAPIFAKDVYRVGPDLYGLLAGALGFGAVFAAAAVGAAGDTLRRSRLVRGALLTYAVALLAFSATSVVWLGLATLFLAGGAYLAVVSGLNTSVQLLVDESIRGRVLAIYVMVFTGAFPVGALVQGWVAELIGAPLTVGIAATVLLLIGLAVATQPRLLALLDANGREEPAEPAAVPDVAPSPGR